MNSDRPVKQFQIRWREPLGDAKCPYLYRWVFIFFGFSIRLHHWIRSDDKRFFHDHPWDFTTFVLKGSYRDVSPAYTREGIEYHHIDTIKAGDRKFRKATHKHYVDVPQGGAWTLLFCGRHKRNWGFWIKANQFFRPLRYFSKYGHPPCSEQ
jgi:hypothetical protein